MNQTSAMRIPGGAAAQGVCKVLSSDRKFVQVVDDDPAVCASLKFLLELEGLSVQTHASGPSLLADDRLAASDCLILDYRMPGMDGFSVLCELAAKAVNIPVILITAPVSDVLRRRAKQLGVFSLLEKPLLDNVLVKNVHDALSA